MEIALITQEGNKDPETLAREHAQAHGYCFPIDKTFLMKSGFSGKYTAKEIFKVPLDSSRGLNLDA